MDLGLVCCFRMDHTNWVLVSTTDMGRNRRCSDDAENSALASPGPATDDRTSTSPYAIHCRPRIREYFLVVAMRIDSSI